MKYFLIAGEASGDLHGSNLIRSIKAKDPEAKFKFLGGDLMTQESGEQPLRHYKDMAFMGIIEVVLHLRTILQSLKQCKQEIALYKPDIVILIDYPGFNLKIAKYVHKKLNIPVCYYISPKIWAWKRYRIKAIKRYVDLMLSILPFEVPFYKGYDFPITYVGNPSVDSVHGYLISSEKNLVRLSEKPILALLCGSRKKEIKDNLPIMLQVAANYPELQPIIAGAPGIDADFYNQFIHGSDTQIVFQETYRLLNQSDVALVTSGTATLETALFNVPQVVCYKTTLPHLVSFIFNNFFHIKFISLVNLIADKEVVKELFGKRFSAKSINQELSKIIDNTDYKETMLKEYQQITNILGEPGAANHAAETLINFLTNQQY